jgi:hypothetical protein
MSNPTPQSAVAFQLSAALESYQGHVDALMNPWRDHERYEAVNRRLREVRKLKGALPQLSVAMVEIVIAHVELMEALWDASRRMAGEEMGRLRMLRERHAAAVQSMRTQCLRAFARSAAA